MKVEKTDVTFYCDCCKIPMDKRLVYRNDGSYQEDFISINLPNENNERMELEICHTCAGRLFKKYYTRLEITTNDIIDAFNVPRPGHINISGGIFSEILKKGNTV